MLLCKHSAVLKFFVVKLTRFKKRTDKSGFWLALRKTLMNNPSCRKLKKNYYPKNYQRIANTSILILTINIFSLGKNLRHRKYFLVLSVAASVTYVINSYTRTSCFNVEGNVLAFFFFFFAKDLSEPWDLTPCSVTVGKTELHLRWYLTNLAAQFPLVTHFYKHSRDCCFSCRKCLTVPEFQMRSHIHIFKIISL